LGEFSPFGRHFILGSFLKISQVAQIFRQHFAHSNLCINVDKNGLSYILGEFFTISSGHPGAKLTPKISPEFHFCYGR
jgi:hypothetical protein